jgi:hypothetical protein
MMKHRLIATALLLLCAGACQKEQTETFPAVRDLYAGSQGENTFQMWIWLFEDETLPALVRSGMCRYLDNQYIDTDEEHLSCQFTEDGFTLSDPATGRVLYTATNVEMDGSSSGIIVHITWDHSPGATWNAHAKEKGWLQEMNLQVQICEGADIIY